MPPDAKLSKEEIAAFLSTTPEALAKFEAAYQKNILDAGFQTADLFGTNSKQAAAERDSAEIDSVSKLLNDRIIGELLAQTPVAIYDGIRFYEKKPDTALSSDGPVTLEEVMRVPASIRPQLTGSLMKRDIEEDGSDMVLWLYKKWLDETDPGQKQMYYNQFRQGLDILDLDPILYAMLGQNPNAMGNWLPTLVAGVQMQDFFKVPKTKIIKVPLTLLQLSRCVDYQALTPGTIDILDRFCQQVFELDEEKTYFIKTGTFSSKFDFRNAKVTGAKEVRELGEYLMYISCQAVTAASPLTTPTIYGMSTTNEWVVREFIPDKEKNPCIYKGLPLHTEYRVFVDFDTREVIGMSPYWEPSVMKKRFAQGIKKKDPHHFHDYMTYSAHEKTLMRRYNQNVDTVKQNVEKMLPAIPLSGQWSIDVMQNGDDFYIIDMALAENSALVECVPPNLLRPSPENWLPQLTA